MSTTETAAQTLIDAAQARGRAAQLREGARGRARGVRRGWGVDRAGGDRAPRRRRDRDALPPLPQPAGAARGALRRRGRGDVPLGRRARWQPTPGRRSTAGSSASSRTSAPSARSPPSCSTTSTRTPRSSRSAATSLFEAGEPLLKRAQEAGVVRPDVDHRRGHPDGHRDRQDPDRATPSRTSTSSESPSTACATAPTRRRSVRDQAPIDVALAAPARH